MNNEKTKLLNKMSKTDVYFSNKKINSLKNRPQSMKNIKSFAGRA